jgi:hypothetical protein
MWPWSARKTPQHQPAEKKTTTRNWPWPARDQHSKKSEPPQHEPTSEPQLQAGEGEQEKYVDVKLKVEKEPGEDKMNIELDVEVDPDPENPDQEPLHTQVNAQVIPRRRCSA